MGQGTGGPRFAVLAQVRAYWQGLRHGMALPQRDMIDPRGIAEALESTFFFWNAWPPASPAFASQECICMT